MLAEQKVLKALVIDDDPVITKVVSRVLVKRMQMNVSEANSAREALALIEQDIPDIMIVDYMMPIMTGKDLIVLLKADERFKNIPTIVLSALSDPDIIKDILSLKVDDYILKPVSPQIIHERVVKVLKNSRERKDIEVFLIKKNKSIIYIGRNKLLFSDILNLLSANIEPSDYEPIPHKAFNLFLQKFHRVVILEKQPDEIVNNLIIEKIKTTNPDSVLIYLVEPDSNLLYLTADKQNLPQNIDEIFAITVQPQKLSEVILKYLQSEEAQ